MRLVKKLQLFLCPAKVICDRTVELEEMQGILDEAQGLDEVLRQILSDINGEGSKKAIGRNGVTAEQVLKLGILRKRHGLTYRELSTVTKDSLSMRQFLNLPMGDGLSKSAIGANLKKVKDSTWEQASQCILQKAKEEKFESGDALRGDTTTVETNIHYPTDSNLLNDSVRVLCRAMSRAQTIIGKGDLKFINHARRAKKKLYKINNLHNEEKRRPLYLELIRVTKETIHHAEAALPVIQNFHGCASLAEVLALSCAETELKTYIPRAQNVVDQAYRRVVKKEQVPASEKIFSIFEEHTDIIVKGFRDIVFGHKVMLTAGTSGMLLSLDILDGNPKDSTLVPDTLTNHKALYGKAPTVAAFDGCFASIENRDVAKGMGVEEITFSKNRSIDLSTLLTTPKLHKMLLNFRAGAEGCISFAKRIFGFSRVLDRTLETFKAALHMGAFAYNLTLLARMRLAKTPD